LVSGSESEKVNVFTTLAPTPQRLVPASVEDEAGQGLVEYSLILAFVVVVAIAALTFLGSDISLALSSIGNSL
jgi:Flp pilus assembly pilin Flp